MEASSLSIANRHKDLKLISFISVAQFLLQATNHPRFCFWVPLMQQTALSSTVPLRGPEYSYLLTCPLALETHGSMPQEKVQMHFFTTLSPRPYGFCRPCTKEITAPQVLFHCILLWPIASCQVTVSQPLNIHA